MGVTNIITHQPVKGLYGLFVILFNAAKLPFWALYFLPRSLRQHPKYSYRQALKSHILKTALWHLSNVHAYTPLSLTSTRKDKDRLVLIHPSSNPAIYTSVCTPSPACAPATVFGYWYPSPYDPAADAGQRVVLHFHGGAFVTGDARPAESAHAGNLLGKHVGKALLVSYRLASNAGGAFPAALQDAVSAYQLLLDMGVAPKDVVVSGDSAGGNLAIALLRYISSTGGVLPEVGAALLWSPWVDLEAALDEGAIARNPRNGSDYLTGNFAKWGAETYAPKGGPVSVSGEWVSPLRFPFRTEARVWVQTGSLEVLLEDNKEWVSRMKGVEGNVVDLHEEEVANHDILLAGALSGFEEAAERCARLAGKWLDTL